MTDCFGYDKYTELTSEQQIRGTYCDLAVKLQNKIKFLIEVKSAGIDLNDSHIRQAVNYGANEGIEWIVLTNSIDWKLYRIKFAQPIDFEEVSSFNILEADLKNEEDTKKIFLLCKEGLTIDAMESFHQQTQILNKHTIAEIIKSDTVVSIVRREFRKLFPEIKIEIADIQDLLANDILKREVNDGDKAKEAASLIKKTSRKLERKKAKKQAKEAEKNSKPEMSEPGRGKQRLGCA